MDADGSRAGDPRPGARRDSRPVPRLDAKRKQRLAVDRPLHASTTASRDDRVVPAVSRDAARGARSAGAMRFTETSVTRRVRRRTGAARRRARVLRARVVPRRVRRAWPERRRSCSATTRSARAAARCAAFTIRRAPHQEVEAGAVRAWRGVRRPRRSPTAIRRRTGTGSASSSRPTTARCCTCPKGVRTAI